jgi:multidrug efflux pump subunit AcrA (membrane-fusion protein)
MEKKRIGWSLIWMIALCGACKETTSEKEAVEAGAGTPVIVAPVETMNISDSIELNATSAFLLNYYVKAASTGYIKTVDATPGQYVNNGRNLFTMQTKESVVIGETISSLDSNFKFRGISNIKATGNGYITQLNHQEGDYVQDGELLAVISNLNSFAFLMNVPYAWRSITHVNERAELYLSDGTHLPGRIASIMPTVDSISQSQVVVIKVDIKKPIPQNLIARVRIPRITKNNAQTLPKSAVQANESQTQFWVMKMIDSATAVKVEVRKGMEWENRIEILDPIFSKNDQIIISGNYGLPDTAKVSVQKP